MKLLIQYYYYLLLGQYSFMITAFGKRGQRWCELLYSKFITKGEVLFTILYTQIFYLWVFRYFKWR